MHPGARRRPRFVLLRPGCVPCPGVGEAVPGPVGGRSPDLPPPRLTPQSMKKRSLLLALAAVVLVLLIIGLCIWLPETSKPHSHVYPRAAVAADAKRCSEIGR